MQQSSRAGNPDNLTLQHTQQGGAFEIPAPHEPLHQQAGIRITMENFWNERYRQPAYAYGTAPNAWYKNLIDKLAPGKILLPADGEGRNGVYASTRRWQVSACDLSMEGRRKAAALASAQGVDIEYLVGDFGQLAFPQAPFDAIALIYAHFDPALRPAYHRLVDAYLKPGGHLMLEAFSRKHIDWQTRYPHIGGPREPAMLYDLEEIRRDFGHYSVIYLQEEIVDLAEGHLHVGRGSVIRFFACKQGSPSGKPV